MTARRATPRVSQILETSLYVEDPSRSRAFYEGLFGFTAFFEDERMCAMEVPGEQVLLLFRHGMTKVPAPGPGGGTVPPHHGQGSLHLAFAIPFGELTSWEAHLAEHAVAVEQAVLAIRRHQPLFPRPRRPFARGRHSRIVAESRRPWGEPARMDQSAAR